MRELDGIIMSWGHPLSDPAPTREEIAGTIFKHMVDAEPGKVYNGKYADAQATADVLIALFGHRCQAETKNTPIGME